MRMNKRNILIGVGAAIVIGTTTYIIFNRRRKRRLIDQIHDILDGNVPSPSQGGINIISQKEYDALPAGQFPIKIGDRNKKVYDIQKMLNSKYGASLDMDGIYGDSTWRTLCDKVWDKWYTAENLSCRDKFYRRRAITQDDYNEIKNYRTSTT